MTPAVLVLTLLLAAANGGNDNGKGVATLGGAGVARYRTAVLWGAGATFAGALASLYLAKGLTTLFSSGIVASPATPAFALAVLIGATAWVALATMVRLPVSTTHAIVGALIGAGLVIGPNAVAWSALATRVIGPLLLSIVLAYAMSAVLNAMPLPAARECVCVSLQQPAVVPVPLSTAVGTATRVAFTPALGLPVPVVTTGSVAECRAHPRRLHGIAFTIDSVHWLSAGGASFARGLNDTPKIAAIGAFALVPAGMSASHVGAAVAVAMAVGGLAAAARIAPRLGDDVVTMDHQEGAKANMATALLVGAGAVRGLPMSLTHVSAGAIAGAAGTNRARLNSSTVRSFMVAWSVTPVVAASVAAASLVVLR